LMLGIALTYLLLYAGFYLYNQYQLQNLVPDTYTGSLSLSPTEITAIKRTEINYGKDIDKYAKELKLPASYFKALIVLECSGHKNIIPRLEKHVFTQLQKVRDGKAKHYYNIKKKRIKALNDAGLKNLASSWGPFQVMGYQVIPMGINVHNIRGDKSIYWGMKWIKKRYGRRIKRGKYKDAFHIHNTGHRYPKLGNPHTHDPKYVTKGLKYIKAFEEMK